MKLSKYLSGILLITMATAVSPLFAQAEVISAEIKKISTEGDSFKIVRQDNHREMEVWLSVETKFEGLSSLHELVAGDEVIVDTQKNLDNGRWEAAALTVSKMVIRNPKSDVETMSETPEMPASAASMEDEARARIKNEMRLNLEGLDKKIDALKGETAKTSQLQERYDILTKDLAPKRAQAADRVAALQISSAVTWDQDKAGADKALQELSAEMDHLERELALEHSEQVPAN